MTADRAVCDCCSGVVDRTPIKVENRPGLSAIAYRIGTHGDFLASMLAGLTSVTRPRLAELTTRDPDDFSIALLDSWAVVADVLTFYAERLGQESYLRTAVERVSLQELGRLIGYRLKPGVAAETHVAFALERPPVPAAGASDPGSAPSVTPSSVAIEPGLRIQSIPGPGEKPQTFETVEEIEARPEWNAIPASTTIPFIPKKGDTEAYLNGGALNLKPGDAFLLAGTDVPGERWDLRILTRVEADPATGRTTVHWAEELGSAFTAPAESPEASVLRKRLNVFGYNAPDWNAMSDDFRNNYPGGEGQTEWPNFVISPLGEPVVDLDGSHPDVVVDSRIVLSSSTQRELWRVKHVAEIARAEFATSGKVTRATLKGGENYSFFNREVRDMTVFAVEERLELADAPDDSDVGGNVIDVDIDVSAMTPGRSVLVTGTTTSGTPHAEVATVAGVQQAAGRWRLTLERSLVETYVRATVVLHGNVALATHGETVDQFLGSGRAATPFQRFDLAHEPLTHVQSSDASGVSSTLEVRVNDVRWDELPTLYGSTPEARAYTVRADENDKTYVQFGDGQRGARLPSGAQNVRATYRKGLGADGNVGPNTLAQLLDRPLGVKGVTNPLPASGGVDPEGEEQARASMPIGVRTLGRAVSLTDYADFALAFAGVAKADAAVLPLRGGPTIVVTVAFADRPPVVPVDRLDDLRGALRGYGDPHVQVDVVPHAEATFRMALKVAVDPAFEADIVLAGVESALRKAYSFESRGFGAPVHSSEITSIVHDVDGIVAVDLDRLYAGPIPLLLHRLGAQRAAAAPDGTALPAGVLLLHPDPLDSLEVMT